MTAPTRYLLIGWASLLGGCIYLNSLYNAQRLFDEAERAHWAGRDAEALELYDSVVAKAARSYRREPDGGWADDALYLLGRAYLQRGEPARAEAALRKTLEISDDPGIRAGARLHLGVAAAEAGRQAEALTLLNDALRVLRADPLRAEGHLRRARILLGAGQTDAGWWDLDRAVEADRRYRTPAGLERLRWGVVHGDRERSLEGASRLLRLREAHVREDSLRSLVQLAARRWGPEGAALLLTDADRSAWPRAALDRLILDRARLERAAGNEGAAVADASRVADGVGAEATEARLLLSDILFDRAGAVEDLGSARAVLLPAVGDPRVLELLESIRVVELLVEEAEAEGGPVEALFAAAEVSRDVLGAEELARSLFLRYAAEETGVWSGKALLAALALTPDPAGRPPLLRRMAGMRNNPYIVAGPVATGSPPRIRELDLELQEGLTRVLAEATERARRLDVLVRERGDTAR